MLPSNVLQAIRFLCGIGYKIGSIPFAWNYSDNTIKWTSSRKRKRVYTFISIYTFANFCFMSVRWAQAYCCMKISYGMLFINLFNIITHLVGAVLFLNTYLKKTGIQRLIFHLMRTNEIFKRNLCSSKYFETSKPNESLIKRCIYPPFIYSLMQFFISIGTASKNPKYVYYLFNLSKVAKWKLIPIGVFEAFMSLSICTIMLFYVFLYLAYVRSTIPCLEVLSSRRLTQKIRHYYRQLQIVNSQFHNLMKYIIMPLLPSTLLIFAIISMYASVKLYHEVKMPGFLGFPFATLASCFCLFEIVPPAYRINQLSKSFISKNKLITLRRKHINFKWLTSMQPLSIYIGNFYKIKRATLLTFLFIGLDATINLLITF